MTSVYSFTQLKAYGTFYLALIFHLELQGDLVTLKGEHCLAFLTVNWFRVPLHVASYNDVLGGFLILIIHPVLNLVAIEFHVEHFNRQQ